jgi:hypothetical protein
MHPSGDNFFECKTTMQPHEIDCDMMLENRNSSLLGNNSVNTFPQKKMHQTKMSSVFCGLRPACCYAVVL